MVAGQNTGPIATAVSCLRLARYAASGPFAPVGS